MNSRLRFTLLSMVMLLACLAVYWPGLHGGFIFDDFPNLVADQDWKLTEMTMAQWRRAVGHGLSSASGRPLAMATFALNHYFTGLDPFWLKLTNLAFHLCNGMLVVALCRLLLAQLCKPTGASQATTASTLIPWVLSAAWLLHPLQVSSVLYVVQRMEIAATTFVLLAVLAYLRGRTLQIAGNRAWPWLAAAAASTVVGCAFKESALLVPGFALLLEICFLKFEGRDGNRSRIWVWAYAAGVSIAVAAFVLFAVPHWASPEAYAQRDFTVGQRLLTQIPVLATYLGQIFYPTPDRLWFYYDNFPISTGLFAPPATAWSAMLLAGLAIVAIASRRRWPMVGFGLGWFLVAHGLTSNIPALELAFEHRNYLALLGVLLALVQPLSWATTRLSPGVRQVVVAMPLIALAFLCSLQVMAWGNPQRLPLELATRNADSPRASYYLGEALLRSAGNDPQTPQWSMARREFEHVADISRTNAMGEQALLIMDGRSQRPISPELWSQLRRKLTLRSDAGPDTLSATHALVNCSIVGQCTWNESELQATLNALLSRYPTSAPVHAIYGNYAQNVLHDPDFAIRLLRFATSREPRNSQYIANLTKVLLDSGSPANRREGLALKARLESMNGDGHLTTELAEISRILAAPPASAPDNGRL
ncbi:hypothetical protein MNR01_14765 [Lysobacter sp. S4-A87]|uniref:hypothetical protein n=1 Tax=Lysobacter sp. S4-A87 TaxID=2925843 RepID=UPI001F532C92|nr:hypothetical protein [Lysobacter sp. S4-A87]UNK48982.1 hypothetical protein MNR01_14765 [Lysobacter sp. S4-A87]